ncbi:MAG TPA: PspC domain-containing protein [Actinomycetes bacterium]|nr:PspC domain-containing protein [Actinomycetes bacterium]
MSDNDTGYAPPPPGYAPPPPGSAAPARPPLRRTTGNDKVIAGVSGGIARTLGIDPILVRVAFVLLTIFGGSGIVLYGAGWLFIPEDGEHDSPGERFFRDNNALVIAAAVVIGVLVAGPLLAWGMWDGGVGFGGFVLLLLVIAGVVALTRRSSGTSSATQVTEQNPAQQTQQTEPQTGSQPGPQTGQQTAVLGTPTAVIEHPTAPIPPGGQPPMPPGPPTSPGSSGVPPVPPPAPTPPREKSVLGRLTVGVALLVAGALIALDLANVVSVSAVAVLAAALAVVAVGLLVGTVMGRSRGLIVLGVALVLVLIPLSAVPNGLNWHTGDGAGDRTYRVRSFDALESEYSLGAGKLTLDLRGLQATPLDDSADVEVSVGAGEVVVLLPSNDDIGVSVDAEAGVGQIDLPGQPEEGGLGAQDSWQREVDTSAASSDSLNLTLSAGLGKVTVIDEPPVPVSSSSERGAGQR